MRKRLIFISLIFAVLIISSVIAQEIVPVELQPSLPIPQSPLVKNYFSFDAILIMLVFVLIPLMVSFFHVFFMLKEWKKSTKLFKITTSIVLVVLLSISFIQIFTVVRSSLEFAMPWLFWPLFAVVFIGWFINACLKNGRKITANTISILGLVIFGLIFLISTLGLFRIMPFYRWDIAGWFAWPFQLVIVIFFIVSTIIINKK